MVAAAIPGRVGISPGSEHVLRPGRSSSARREHAAATLGAERRDFSILQGSRL